MAGNDIVYGLVLNDQPYVQGMARAANAARQTADQIEKDAKRAQNAFVGRNSAQFTEVASNGLLFDPLAKTRMRDDLALRSRLEETYRKRNIAFILQEADAEKTLGSARSAANSQLKGVVGSSQSGLRAIQQLAFGVEDAATQFGTMGLAGAIRGAGNNISAAAMAFGPAASVAASLGVTALMVGTNFFKMGEETKKAEKAVDEFAAVTRRAQADMDALRSKSDFTMKLKSVGDMSAKDAKKAAEDAESQQHILMADRIRAEEDFAQKMRSAAAARQKDIQKEAEQYKTTWLQAGDRDKYKALERQYAEQQKIIDAGKTELLRMRPMLEYGEDRIDQIERAREEAIKLGREEQFNAEYAEKLRKREPVAQEFERQTELNKAAQESLEKRIELQKQQQDEAEAVRKSTLTPQEKYLEQMKDLIRLKKQNPTIINEDVFARAAKKARLEMQGEMDKGVSIRASAYVDARSAEALRNYYQHLVSAKSEIPMPAATGPLTDSQLIAQEQKRLELLKGKESLQGLANTGNALMNVAGGLPGADSLKTLGDVLTKAFREALKPNTDETKKQTAAISSIKFDTTEALATF